MLERRDRRALPADPLGHLLGQGPGHAHAAPDRRPELLVTEVDDVSDPLGLHRVGGAGASVPGRPQPGQGGVGEDAVRVRFADLRADGHVDVARRAVQVHEVHIAARHQRLGGTQGAGLVAVQMDQAHRRARPERRWLGHHGLRHRPLQLGLDRRGSRTPGLLFRGLVGARTPGADVIAAALHCRVRRRPASVEQATRGGVARSPLQRHDERERRRLAECWTGDGRWPGCGVDRPALRARPSGNLSSHHRLPPCFYARRRILSRSRRATRRATIPSRPCASAQRVPSPHLGDREGAVPGWHWRLGGRTSAQP